MAFVMNGEDVASVCVAPLKGRDRAVEKAANMPIGPDKDRTEGPAIAWVHRFYYDASEMHEGKSTSRSGRCSQSITTCRSSMMEKLGRSSDCAWGLRSWSVDAQVALAWSLQIHRTS